MGKSKKRFTILSVFEITDLDDIDAVLMKLRHGLDVNAIDSDGRTLLMEATIWRKHRLMEILIRQGADVNKREKREWTALHFAAQDYDLRSVKLLVENGAEINAIDDYGANVLLRAVMNAKGQGDVIKFLVKHGADGHVKNKSGISALDSAKNISNYDLLPFFEL